MFGFRRNKPLTEAEKLRAVLMTNQRQVLQDQAGEYNVYPDLRREIMPMVDKIAPELAVLTKFCTIDPATSEVHNRRLKGQLDIQRYPDIPYDPSEAIESFCQQTAKQILHSVIYSTVSGYSTNKPPKDYKFDWIVRGTGYFYRDIIEYEGLVDGVHQFRADDINFGTVCGKKESAIFCPVALFMNFERGIDTKSYPRRYFSFDARMGIQKNEKYPVYRL